MFKTINKTSLEDLIRKGDEIFVTNYLDEMRIKMPAVRIAQGNVQKTKIKKDNKQRDRRKKKKQFF